MSDDIVEELRSAALEDGLGQKHIADITLYAKAAAEIERLQKQLDQVASERNSAIELAHKLKAKRDALRGEWRG